MTYPRHPLINVLLEPKIATTLDRRQWQDLYLEAYRTQLLARIAHLLKTHNYEQYIPQTLRGAFDAAQLSAQTNRTDILLLMKKVVKHLKSGNINCVFLKGAGYIAADIAVADGRTATDVDILVDADKLDQVEAILQFQGWQPAEKDEHDDHYYREWMHELPPFVDSETGANLDVHHNLLPKTFKTPFSVDKLLITDGEFVHLSLKDQAIHSAVHLLSETEFQKGLRDCHDLYLLFNAIAETDATPEALLERADHLNVKTLVSLAIEVVNRTFKLPAGWEKTVKPSNSEKRVARLVCLASLHGDYVCAGFKTKCIHFLLFIRGHYLKMPMRILIPHLLFKGIIKPLRSFFKSQQTEQGH